MNAMLVALFAAVALTTVNAAIIQKAPACQVCLTVIGKVIVDVQGTDHNPGEVERAIQKECRNYPFQHPFEVVACIADLSLAIPVIERDLENGATSNAQKICSDIRICH